jgi:hypothetical protein
MNDSNLELVAGTERFFAPDTNPNADLYSSFQVAMSLADLNTSHA